nr:putative phage abortive infection protein [Oceanicola sp. 502str15]
MFLKSSSNEIGDTLAGIAGTLAFLWIIVTVWLQSQELAAQREVLSATEEEFHESNLNYEKQRFETSFFELISTQNSITSSIRHTYRPLRFSEGRLVSEERLTVSGRDYFPFFYNLLFDKDKDWSGVSPAESLAETLAEYRDLYEKQGANLGHYFRFTYNAMRTISENPHCQPRHKKLFRALFSDYELAVLFYNCQTTTGANMMKYAETFALFNNLPKGILISEAHRDFVPPSCFGEES